jgi:hypothetical protein
VLAEQVHNAFPEILEKLKLQEQAGQNKKTMHQSFSTNNLKSLFI